MKKPHKHAELIKAWADGAEIEVWNTNVGKWLLCGKALAWEESREFRIKPEPKPDYISTRRVFLKRCDSFGHYAEMENNALSGNPNNVKFIFDGETGLLKDAEVLK